MDNTARSGHTWCVAKEQWAKENEERKGGGVEIQITRLVST